MKIIEILEKTESAAQGNARLQVLHDACPKTQLLLKYALSPSVTFGVKKLPPPSEYPHLKTFSTEEGWLSVFIPILDQLSNRTLTGKNAQAAIHVFLGACTPLQQKWSERILKQDLRLNIGAKEINKIFPGLIPEFSVPLATDYNKCKPKDYKGRWVVQPKMDGARCVTVLPKNGGEVYMLSRTGKEWHNFESIRLILDSYNKVRNRKDTTIYLDGEIVSYLNGKIDFQAIQKNMMRKDGVETGELVYYVFDFATETEWNECILPYQTRWESVGQFLANLENDKIRNVQDLTTLTDPTDKPALLELCKQSVQNGFEGLILREIDSPVEKKRGKKLLKLKMFQDSEAIIVGMTEGTGDLQGSMGSLMCEKEGFEGMHGVKFEIGSGFSESERQEFWNNKETYIGKLVNFKFFEYTQAGVPRFPIYRSVRHEDDVS